MIGGYFWQDNETFVDDGIQIEPFNLSNEREEGYFDADGNFVEYINDNEIKVLNLVYAIITTKNPFGFSFKILLTFWSKIFKFFLKIILWFLNLGYSKCYESGTTCRGLLAP